MKRWLSRRSPLEELSGYPALSQTVNNILLIAGHFSLQRLGLVPVQSWPSQPTVADRPLKRATRTSVLISFRLLLCGATVFLSMQKNRAVFTLPDESMPRLLHLGDRRHGRLLAEAFLVQSARQIFSL